MGWITIAGKGLEFSGKIMQSASFEAWAQSKGQQIVENRAREHAITWFGKKRAARKEIWKDLKLIVERPALHAALSRLASEYPDSVAAVANSFENNHFSADERTYVVPRFAVNHFHRATLEAALSTSDEFENLKGGPLLRSYFYDEFLEQLDSAFYEMRPKPDNPIRLGGSDWYVVGMDNDYDWLVPNENWKGHFFIHGSTDDFNEKKRQKIRAAMIKTHVNSLNVQMGLFSTEQKRVLAESWMQMKDSLIAGRDIGKVSSLMTGR